MKKLSLSVFAVLAIALAVTSAFTTKHNAPNFNNEFVIVGIQNDQVDAVDQSNFSLVLSKKETSPADGLLYDLNTDPDASMDSPGELATWLAAKRVSAGGSDYIPSCDTQDDDDICAVFYDHNGSNYVVRAIILGDFEFTLDV